MTVALELQLYYSSTVLLVRLATHAHHSRRCASLPYSSTRCTVHLPSADISSGIFPSDGTRPIHFWKAERETLRLLYRTSAAEIIQTFYRQINFLHADCESLWGTEMNACNDCSQQRQPAPE